MKSGRKKKRLAAAVILLLVVGVVGAYFIRPDMAQQPQWLTLKVSHGDLDVVVTATGTLAPDTTVQVGTQVSGTIAALYADWNSHVKAGQTIAMLDTTLLWVSVEQAQANLSKANVASDEAKTNFEMIRQLYQKELVSQSDYDTALASYQSAEADVKSAKNQLDEANIELGYATIKAPISGVVISRNIDLGQTVASSYSTPKLFSIANSLSDMQVQALVDEGDIGSVRVGQTATFTVDAFPNNTFGGKVTQVRLQPTDSSNVIEYTVIIDAPNHDLKLMPGMTANLTIHIAQSDDVLMVPTTALRFTPPENYLARLASVLPDSVVRKLREAKSGDSAGSGPGQGGYVNRELKPGNYFVVWVLDGKQIKPVRVRIGLSDGTRTQVDGNLTAGEAVIVGTLVTGTGGKS